jgi:hypothetical protein
LPKGKELLDAHRLASQRDGGRRCNESCETIPLT